MTKKREVELLALLEAEKQKRLEVARQLKTSRQKYHDKIEKLQAEVFDLQDTISDQRDLISRLRSDRSTRTLQEQKEVELLRYGITMSHHFFMMLKQSPLAQDVLRCAGLEKTPK